MDPTNPADQPADQPANQPFTLEGAFDPAPEPDDVQNLILHFATDLNCAADDFIERYREMTHTEVPEYIAKLISILDNEIINVLYGYPRLPQT